MLLNLDTILLIDDDEIVNFLNKIIIDRSGIVKNVIVASSATEALELLEEMAQKGVWPDIMLVDINMPGVDGWKFIELLDSTFKSIENNFSVSMLSSTLDPRDYTKAELTDSIQGLFSKPLTTEVVSTICEKHLNSSK